MISPGDSFNAFKTHRYANDVNEDIFEIGKRRIISAEKNAVFTFFHLVNRTVTNVPWVFWLQLFLTFFQLAIAVILPFNKNYWSEIPEMLKLNEILVILIRFVPLTASNSIQIGIFALYAVVTIGLSIFTATIIHLIKERKEVTVLIRIYFFIFAVFMPILKNSISCLLANQILVIFKDQSFGSFMLALFALACIVLHFFNIIFFAFGSATSPNPNMHNPLAIWSPNAMHNVEFESFMILNFIILELTKYLKPMECGIGLTVYLCLILIPQFIYHRNVTYFILFLAYEFMYTILLSTIIFESILLVYAFVHFEFPFVAIMTIWVVLPIAVFLMIYLVIQGRVRKILKNLDKNKPKDYNQQNTEMDDEEEVENALDGLNVKTPGLALKYMRVARIYEHELFMNLTLARYFLRVFPSLKFPILHLSFLVPDKESFVTNLIDIFLDDNKPTFLEEAIIFQILTSLQESSNELSPSMTREVSHQNLMALKCQQVLSKVWFSCYKGDVTAMAKNAFLLNKLIKNLNKKWTYLALRYPFSIRILKEYVTFLKTLGCQHAKADAICKANPKVADNQEIGMDTNINLNILRQAVEEASDRRPIQTAKKLSLALILGVTFMTLIMLSTVGLSIYMFSRTNESVYLLANTGRCLEFISQTPNIFSKISEIESNPMSEDEFIGRDFLYNFTKKLSDSYNVMLDLMPAVALKEMKNHPEYVTFEFLDYSEIKKTTLIGALSNYIYFENSLTYVPKDDDLVGLVNKNLDNASRLVVNTAKDIILDSTQLTKMISSSSYIFFSISLCVILLVFIPIFIYLIKCLKEEMNYLFSLYLTIPRKTIKMFIENSNVKKVEHKSTSMMQSSTLQTHTSITDITASDTQQEDTKGNIVDNFKIIITDNSSNQDVLPPNFTCKLLSVVIAATSLPLIIGIVNVTILNMQISEFNRCMETINIISLRTHSISTVINGLLSNTLMKDDLKKYINTIMEYHTELLFAKDMKISEKMFNSYEFQNIHFEKQCNNSEHCKSLVSLFDDIIIVLTDMSNKEILSGDDPVVKSMRDIYIMDLFPLMSKLQDKMTSYVMDEVALFQMIIVIMALLAIIVLIIIFSTCAAPIIGEMVDAIKSVKLPLKFMNPIDLSDQGKLMQYLQGECDYGSQKINDTKSNGPSGSTFLNAIMSPFAVFESDLSLLFANTAFYQLLGTTREAIVGLPLVNIFSHVMSFWKDENHPFNSLLETIQQLQRGVAAQNFAEIITDMEIKERSKFPIMVRLVGIDNSKDSDHDESSTNLKATQYIVHVTNLTAKRELEDKLKYEADITTKLFNNSIDPVLLQGISENEILKPKKYTERPLLMFTVNAENNDNESNDDILVGCSTFIKSFQNVQPSFRTVSKLKQYAPIWLFAGGTNLGEEDKILGIDELAQFALATLDIFMMSIPKKNITLSAVIHVSDFIVIPLQFELPQIEIIGKGYEEIVSFSDVAIQGKLIATNKAEEYLSTLKNVILSPLEKKKNDEYYFTVDKFKEQNEGDEFQIV